MATANVNAHCSICEEETNTFICRGCSKDFCFDHLTEHRQSINEQIHSIQDDYNEFRQLINDLKNNPEKHSQIEQIDQWENDSIIKIKQKAKKCREILINYRNQTLNQIEIKLNNSNEQLISDQKKKDFNEIYLNELKEKLEKLKKQLNQSTIVSIEEQSNSFINQIFIRFGEFSLRNIQQDYLSN
jgi:DNA repair exonuclease SbcCD ATPase subunit